MRIGLFEWERRRTRAPISTAKRERTSEVQTRISHPRRSEKIEQAIAPRTQYALQGKLSRASVSACRWIPISYQTIDLDTHLLSSPSIGIPLGRCRDVTELPDPCRIREQLTKPRMSEWASPTLPPHTDSSPPRRSHPPQKALYSSWR